jgi:hypothetical protein
MPIFKESDRVALYGQLRSFESDFDRSQSQMRAISSAWTAAVLAAIALLITTTATPIVVPPNAILIPNGLIDVRADALAYLRAVICVVGSAGVLAFWYIDQGVYQRLLHSVFAYGMHVEASDPELPQIRRRLFQANSDVTNRLGTFYRAQFWLFVAISIGTDLIGRLVAHSPLDRYVWFIIGAHLFAAIVFEIASRTWPSLSKAIGYYPKIPDLPSEQIPKIPVGEKPAQQS